jgi:hypothetical protein
LPSCTSCQWLLSQRELILACTDIAVLDAWIGRAAVASAVADVLG